LREPCQNREITRVFQPTDPEARRLIRDYLLDVATGEITAATAKRLVSSLRPIALEVQP
jgi:hypothetical protein